MKFIAIVVLATATISGCTTQDRIVNDSSLPDTVEHYVEEVREHFTIQGQPIHPFVFRDLGGWISDGHPIVTAVDVLAGVNSNYYFADDIERKPYGFGALDQDGQSYYSYEFLGRLENGLLVVKSDFSGGGSGTFRYLYMLDVVVDTAFSDEGDRYERVNLKATRIVTLGDRWGGDITLAGNTVTISGKRMVHMSGPITTRVIEMRRP